MPSCFVSTGFPSLDSMIAGAYDCKGFPRGGVSLITGGTGSGKTTILRKTCERAYSSGLRVVWVDPLGITRAAYRVYNEAHSMNDLAHLMSKLLHPGNQKKRADLIVIDDVHAFSVDPEGPLAERSRTLGTMFQGNLGSTAVVLSLQSRSRISDIDDDGDFVVGRATRSSRSDHVHSRIADRGYNPPAALGHQSRVTLGVSKNGSRYDLKLIKSVVSQAGVSCTVNPEDLIDRSLIPTRYERILRGRD